MTLVPVGHGPCGEIKTPLTGPGQPPGSSAIENRASELKCYDCEGQTIARDPHCPQKRIQKPALSGPLGDFALGSDPVAVL